MTTAVLLLSCRDQKGLVAAVSDFLFRNEGNIVHADQHSDHEEGLFLQRVEWQLDGFILARDQIADAFRPIAERFAMKWDLRFSDDVCRMAVLVSREAHCLVDLLARLRMGELCAEVPIVIGNHDDLRGETERYGVPYRCLPVEDGNESAQAAQVGKALRAERIDLIVLARYMRVLPESLVNAFDGRIINIHHSFLPAFKGAKPYHQAHDRGVKIIGATAHYVTADLDQGPIVEQDVVRVSHRDDVRDLIHKGRDLERVVLARAVKRHLEGRVIVYGNKTVVFD